MKYTSKSKLKYVLVKNDKESKPFKTIYDIYKASDTYSGVHYAKGGLTDAKYVSKRNSQVVDDNGKIVSDKLNGVWLKETAKPVGKIEGTEAMELKTAADWENYLKGGSGSQEVELTPNVIRKGMYGWKGKTYSKGQINGYDWDITTIKVSSGKLVSSIQGGSRSKGDGFESFQFTMFQDPSANLIVTAPKVVNEKRVREQHEQAVEEFKRLVREGRLPEKKYAKGGKLFGAGNFAEGGSIGFIPMDMEEDLRLIGKWGDISIKQVIGLLNAMIDSGVTDEDLVPKPTKNTSFQREKAEKAKIKEIWTRIEPNYKGDLIGNRYYSSLKELIGRNWIYQDLLKKYKPLRKLHKDEVEIETDEVRKMSGGDAVLYKDEQWYVTEKNGQLGIGNFRQGAWGMDFPFIPLSRIDMDSLTDMMGRKVQIVKGYAKGGMFGAGNFAEGGKLENISPVLKPKIEAIERILPKALGESSMKIEFAFQTNTGYAFNMISKTDYPVNRATPKLKKIGVEVERTGEKGRRLITIPRGVFDKMTAIYADGGLIQDMLRQRDLTDMQIRTQLLRELGLERASRYMSRDNDREHGVSALSLLMSAVSKGWLSVDEMDINVFYAASSAADETAELEEIGSSDMNFILKGMLENAGIEMGYEGNRIVRKYSNPEEVNIKDKTHRNGK
jgi:hypothetical protein